MAKKMRRQPRPSAEAYDRGEAVYFHGRGEILEAFEDLTALAMKQGRGMSALIQGAPGSGKTAILHECAMRADGEGWDVAKIHERDFGDTRSLLKRLGGGGAPFEISLDGL